MEILKDKLTSLFFLVITIKLGVMEIEWKHVQFNILKSIFFTL